MKFEFDRKYFKICLYAFVTVAALLLFQRILQASDDIWQSLRNGLSFLLELLSPFILAILIAYILSPAVAGIETLLGKIFKKNPKARWKKLTALLVVYLAMIAVIVLALYWVIPGIVRNIGDLIANLPAYWEQLEKFYADNLMSYPLIASDAVQNAIGSQMEKFNANLAQYLSDTLSGITNFLLRFVSSVASGILGLILSFYLLNEREHIVESFTRLVRARLGDRRSASVMSFLHAVDRVFGRYISAKLLLALIMFVICFVVFNLMHVRYVVLMSAIVGITTLVPYIGPFIGAVPPIVISLLESPQKAVWVGIAIIVIHQADNYFLEPYVLSDRMGLSPFWVLLSIILGGGLFGLWGILLAVPVAAVIKLLIDRYIRGRHLRRQREQDQQQGNGGEGRQ